MPPAVPQANSSQELVGLIIQNLLTTESQAQYTTFGQVFKQGTLSDTDHLGANTAQGQLSVQKDTLAKWPDGSVKFAAITLKVPKLCGQSELPLLLTKIDKANTPDTPVDLNRTRIDLQTTINFSSGSYTGTQIVDLGAALKTALKNAPDYWLHGPHASQARVDVPMLDGKSPTTSTLHLTADITVYDDGTAKADVQFNNDLTTVIRKTGSVNPQPPLAPLVYSTTIQLHDQKARHDISQYQYTSWHTVLATTPPSDFNIQHDPEYLIQAGAVLPYDLSTGVNNALLESYTRNILQKPDFGQPLATNGVTTYMPMTGGRPDIGFTTQYNTVWLMTQDARARKVALAQSDTSAAIPWNYKLRNGTWLTPESHPDIWVDGRGGPHSGTSGIANVASSKQWSPDSAHQPNLNYIPYLLSATRWNLDRLISQASYGLTEIWPSYRCRTPSCNTVANGRTQLRSQAWSFRELLQASFITSESAPVQPYFSRTVSENWNYLKSQQASLSSRQGEATGWLSGDYGNKGATAEWQQDFFTVIATMASFMGHQNARDFVAWQTPWLSGRFIGNGMNPYDGCNYNLMVSDKTTGDYFDTWSAIFDATVTAGLSNGTSWEKSNGYYCALARSALSTAMMLSPDEPKLASALNWLLNANAPWTSLASFRADPTYNIRLPSSISATRPSSSNQLVNTEPRLPPAPTWKGSVRREPEGDLVLAND